MIRIIGRKEESLGRFRKSSLKYRLLDFNRLTSYVVCSLQSLFNEIGTVRIRSGKGHSSAMTTIEDRYLPITERWD
ncbi:hypothetical protein TNCV_3525641 [Trichonephila clavipes]|uniref:Uncharacterized protein n=1 Tax=Trichonephila clavipes TaxID=2585209 RepID=A0A8X6SGT4_TRICX|nr:hypothetical protein TNCV_3525641 [Trichonephila clavipes]